MAKHSSYRSTERTRKGAVTKFGSRTDVGSVREQNEDSLVVRPPLFVVADGMGGHAAGEVASEIAVSTIEELAPDFADAEALGHAVEEANRDIINAALSGEGREGMGTTVTAAVLERNHLVIAQVGDSRAYLLHNGELTQLTRDHSLMANMIEAGQITPEEARFHPSRSVITRALGNDPDTVPDLYEINVEDGDRLLLCSDGLYSMLEDDEIAAVMRRVSDPQKCATTLVNGAIAAGGHDNVTVIVADAEGTAHQKRKRMAIRTKITIGFVLLLLAGIIAAAIWGGSTYLHNTAYLAETESGMVAVYRGVPGDVLGFTYSELVEETDIPVKKLSPSAAERISENMRVSSVDEALELVDSYRAELEAQQAKEKAEADAKAARSAAAAEEDEAYEEDEEPAE
ncbi:MAG: Stp1/IreP family PP2C-type Ser/Thr phosphatase [Eggerthellaceae bacterium]|nr:Stp1/IreP family PP2C-type Ser/Thr phosphatase [Eggerthellaceae bacterium]